MEFTVPTWKLACSGVPDFFQTHVQPPCAPELGTLDIPIYTAFVIQVMDT